ncbi:MAG: hypothetical protein HQM12_17670, partial [SAR324 cluster bacterium]|nr:hypothetical protein [SAR324 cluster bacterium]
MLQNLRFTTESHPVSKTRDLPSSGKIHEVIQSIQKTGIGLDTESSNASIQLCRKLDESFQSMSDDARRVVAHQYSFFSTVTGFLDFIKKLFKGGTQHKEQTFRKLLKKISSTNLAVEQLTQTPHIFVSEQMHQQVGNALKSMLDALNHLIIQLIPPNLPQYSNRKLSPRNLSMLSFHKT